MATPVPEETHEQGRSDLTIDLPAGPGHNRAILWAGGLSASLHLLLLSVLGVASLHRSSTGPAPEVRLSLEVTDDRYAEHDMPVPLERPVPPVARPAENVLASVGSSRPTIVESRPVQPTQTTEPQPPTTSSEASTSTGGDALTLSASTEPVHGDSLPDAIPVLTTEGASAREAPAHTEAAAQPGIAISSGQESMLSTWVMQAVQRLREANLTQATVSLQYGGRQYTALLKRQAATDDMGIDRIKVEITTKEDGKLLRTLLQLKQLAFSHFTQLVDRWDEMQLHDDQIEGRFHSNTEIHVGYDVVAPRFLGTVTTASVSRYHIENTSGHRSMREIFRHGVETKMPRIALPDTSPSFVGLTGDGTKVRSFARETRVTFYPDGSYGWREIGSSAAEQRQEMTAPQFMVAAPGTTLSVRGTVKGTVVVYSPAKIVVEGNLVYAHDPKSHPDSDDYLGLISNRDVEVAPPGQTGPGDLEIDGAIYAKRRFVVSEYEYPVGQKACPCKATLVIHGSLTAGLMSPTEPRYATRYTFDPRFEQVRPPGFPVTDRYEVESWDTQWREADARPAFQ